jgi:hypothetical protein
MRKIIVLSLLALAALAGPGLAQDYSFTLPRNTSWLVITPAGQADLYYELTFACDPGAHPIDIVDIGLPNGSYQLGGAMARIGQTELEDIRVSEYVKPYGVEVHLGSKTIRPGDSATLFFNIHLKKLLYRDSKDQNYVSFEFSPTWYGSKYVSGSTRLECNFSFPPGMGTNEPRYHQKQFTEARLDTVENVVIYRWVLDSADPDRQYTFGASFPAKYVPKGAVKQPAPFWQKMIGGIAGFIFGIFKFFFSTFVFWIFAIAIFFGIRQQKTRRMKYLPPEVSIEGVGIKRGLTAPQAGIILEMPLDKVLSMVLFGLVKKEAVEVTDREPKLRIKVLRPELAALPYEKSFLEALDKYGLPDEVKLREAAIKLIKEVNDKMKGFSRKDTAAYYRGIINQAWKQVQDAQTPELKSQPLEDQFDWLMMDGDYKNRMTRHYGAGDVFLPRWWGRSGYGYHYGGGGTTAKTPGGTEVQMPKLPGADFANKLTTGVESVSAGLVGKLDSFTGGVTDKTNPIPVSSGGRSSGGGGCACACACAGCACACAGGGR